MKKGGLFAFFKPTPAKAAAKHAPDNTPEIKGNATAAHSFKRKAAAVAAAEPGGANGAAQQAEGAFAKFAAKTAPLKRADDCEEMSATPPPSERDSDNVAGGGGGGSSSSSSSSSPSPTKKPKTNTAVAAAVARPPVSTKRSAFGPGSGSSGSAKLGVAAASSKANATGAAKGVGGTAANRDFFTSSAKSNPFNDKVAPKRKMGSGAKKKISAATEKQPQPADDDDSDEQPVRRTKPRARLRKGGSSAKANKRRIMDTSDDDSGSDAAMGAASEDEESEFSGDAESSAEEESSDEEAASSSSEEEAESSEDDYAAKKKAAAAARKKKTATAPVAAAKKAATPAKSFGCLLSGAGTKGGSGASTSSPFSGGGGGGSGGGGGGTAGGGELKEVPREGCKLMGEHHHDRLKWLQPGNRCDLNGNLEGEPGYDGRTLRVPASFLHDVSPAQQQWWAIKAVSFDTVLFFKVGKFYEMFNTDADIGVRHLELTFMKGDSAHSGFPELAYGKHAERLIAMGYKVGRVEQTETPEMVVPRKKADGWKARSVQGHGGTWKDKSGSCSRREVVSMLSAGTRTHCYMDTDGTSDASIKFEGSGLSHGRSALGQGWLLTLVEFPVTATTAAGSDDATPSHSGVQSVSNRATRVYGAVLLDAATGAFHFAQFEDCAQSTQLRTMLALYPVVELLVCSGAANGSNPEMGGGLSPSTQEVLRHFLPLQWERRSTLQHGRAERSRSNDSFTKEAHLDAFAAGTARGGFRAPSDGTRVPMAAFFPADGAAGAAAMLRSERGCTYFRDDTGTPLKEANWPPLLRALLRAADAPGAKSAADDEAPFLVHGIGGWHACLAALGGCLQHLARFLLDHELFSMSNFALYTPKMQAAAIMEQAAEQAEAAALTSSPAVSMMEVDNGVATENSSGSSSSSSSSTTPAYVPPTAVHMVLDNAALANLEVLQNQHDGGRRGTLLEFMDKCTTPFGKRLFRNWLAAPLCDLARIERRTDAVAALANATITGGFDLTRRELSKLPDLPRLLQVVHTVGNHYKATDHPAARAVMYEKPNYNKRKVKALCAAIKGFETACKLIKTLQPMLREDGGALAGSALLRELLLYPEEEAVDRMAEGAAPSAPTHQGWGDCAAVGASTSGFPDVSEELLFFRKAFDKTQALQTGEVIPRKGFSPSFDAALAAVADAEAALEDYLKTQKRVLGFSGLKYWGKNKDRYQLEVPVKVIQQQSGGAEPAEYELKSQTKTVKRFWTAELKEMLADMLKAEAAREAALGDQMRTIFHTFDRSYGKWAAATDALAQLDALASLGGVSCYEGYVRATFRERSAASGPSFVSVRGRHPTVEAALKDGSFIPNGTTLGVPDSSEGGGARANEAAAAAVAPLLLLSGPNMGGKSTLLRQNCVLAIMAQMGCFVPADSLELTPVDRIFTRLGASDRILQGQSTFFVELAETATILHEATADSLVILDELGRGTSTFDGTAIADAVVRHVASRLKCRTMFATHYHSLVEDYGNDPRVQVRWLLLMMMTMMMMLMMLPSEFPRTDNAICRPRPSLAQLGHMACIADPTKQSDADTDVTFLYELQPGPCSKSYGVNVARLARLPAAVVALASQKSEEFARTSKTGPSKGSVRALAQRGAQLCNADASTDAVGVLGRIVALQAEAKITLGM